MIKQNKKHPLPVIILCCTAVLLLAAVLLAARYADHLSADYRADVAALESKDYSAVFCAMYPVENYSSETFLSFRGIDTLVTAYSLPSYKLMLEYLSRAVAHTDLERFFIGVRPDLMTAEELTSLMNTYVIPYDVLISYPSDSYWTSLSDRECEQVLAAYRTFITKLATSEDTIVQQNLFLSFYGGQRWLSGNPDNYESDLGVNPDIADKLLKQVFCDHYNQITADNYEQMLAEFEAYVMQLRSDPEPMPDLSGWDVVFFGDSIIGNFTDSSSIPGALTGLTGAHTYNCGMGGTSAAAPADNTSGAAWSAAQFLAGEASEADPDSRLFLGIQDYLAQGSDGRRKCFVLNYGLNDYFNGAPVSSADALDIHTYTGGLRSAATALQNAYPDALIILAAPNFTTYFNCGSDIQSEDGGTLEDYVNAVLETAADMELPTLDSYHDLDINADNASERLEDGCHPNDNSRYDYAELLAQLIEEHSAD